MDITAVTTYLAVTVTAAVVGLGGTILLLAVTGKGFSWMNRMLGR